MCIGSPTKIQVASRCYEAKCLVSLCLFLWCVWVRRRGRERERVGACGERERPAVAKADLTLLRMTYQITERTGICPCLWFTSTVLRFHCRTYTATHFSFKKIYVLAGLILSIQYRLKYPWAFTTADVCYWSTTIITYRPSQLLSSKLQFCNRSSVNTA